MTAGRHRWRTHALVTAVVAALAAAGALAGCSSARADLGTSNAPCYVALPAAAGAVHHHGRLVGVRLRTRGSLRGTPEVTAVVGDRPSGQRLCIIAFAGHYRTETVLRGRGRPSGRLAVVVLSYPANRVLATVLLAHPPLEFGHNRAGPS